MMRKISVVIPCFNGEGTLKRQLDALSAQKPSALVEILVADNLSTDGTAQVIEEAMRTDPRVRRVEADHGQGINYARNAGVRAATGSFILLCDADDEVGRDWVECYLPAIEGGAALVGGSLVHVDSRGTDFGTTVEPYSHLWDHPWPAGANCGFSRAVFDQVGGFDESFRGGGDETDFFWRAQLLGCRLEFVPEARVRYYQRSSSRAVMRQFMAYGRSEAKLYRKFRSQGMPRSSLVRAPIAAISAIVGLVISGGSVSSKTKYAARLGRNIGRIQGSVRERVWYL